THDELGSAPDVVSYPYARFFHRDDWIRHVGSVRMAVRSRTWPRDSRTGRPKQRCSRSDFITHPQRHITPVSPAAVHVRSIDQIADADGSAEPVISEPLKMIDEVLAREVFLRHRAVPIVLV